MRIATCLQMYDKLPDQATAQQLARECALVIGPWGAYNGYQAAMKQASPGTDVFAYVNGITTSEQGYPDEWYAKDLDGNRILTRGWGTLVMNPRSSSQATVDGVQVAGWPGLVRHQAERLHARYAYDGFFVDMLGTSVLAPAFNEGGRVPVDPQTGAAYDPVEWMRTVSPIAVGVRELTGKVEQNALSNSNRYPVTKTAYDYVDECMAETWLRQAGDAATSWPKLRKWLADVEMLQDVASNGKRVHVICKVWTTATSSQYDLWRRLAAASFLLGAGADSLFEFSVGTAAGVSGAGHQAVDPWKLAWSSLYSRDYGAPQQSGVLDSYRQADGVTYARRFEAGVVSVNTATWRAALPAGL